VAIGTTGLFIIEIKHWDRGFLKLRPNEVQHEAIKLNDKVRRLVGKLRKSGIDPGFVTGRFLLTKDTSKLDPNRPVQHGCEFYGQSEWRQLLKLDDGLVFDDSTIERAAQLLQPQTRVAISGDIRRIANVRNLELQSPSADRFHRIYRGEHVRSRDKVILHLYDVSASTDTEADRVAGQRSKSPTLTTGRKSAHSRPKWCLIESPAHDRSELFATLGSTPSTPAWRPSLRSTPTGPRTALSR
jgi:hypothetical protein